MAVHTSKNECITCKICGRSYGSLSNLRIHSITHSSDRPYECHFCKKTFKRNQELKFHINQHTGAKPYQCPFCDKAFTSSGNCNAHKIRMHPRQRCKGKNIQGNNNFSKLMNKSLMQRSPIYTENHLCIMKKANLKVYISAKRWEPCQQYYSKKQVARRGLLDHHNHKHHTKNVLQINTRGKKHSYINTGA